MSDQSTLETGQIASVRSPSAGRLPAFLHWPSSAGGRARAAALAGVGLFALLALLLFTHLLSLLPGYPAVLVAFFVWAVLPGWLLQRAVFATRGTGPIERMVVAFLVSMALAAAPGLVSLTFHWSLQVFALSYAALAAVASALAIMWQPTKEDAPGREEPDRGRGDVLLAGLLGLAVVAVLSSPWWAGDQVPRDGDDLVFMAYVHEYATSDALDASKPFFDTRQGAYGRMSLNVWVVVEALVVDSAGVDAFGLLMDYLPPLMTVLAVAAMFTLARGLFRNTTVALLAAAFVFAFAVLDLSPHDGYGRNIFLRIAQDKMIATYVLLPVGLLFGARFLRTPSARTYVALLLAVVALSIVHPMAVMFMGVGVGFAAALRALVERSRVAMRSAAWLLLPWVSLSLVFVLRSWLAESQGGTQPYRKDFFLLDLPGGFVIGNYHLILHPFFMTAVVLAPLLWLAARRDVGRQVMLATVLGVLVIFFVPVFSTRLAEDVSEHALWRLPRLIPVPLILGYATYLAMDKLLRSEAGAVAAKASPFLASISLLPVGALLLATAGAFLAQEQYGMVDGGAYYQRFSDIALVPWTGGSVFVGGFEHASMSNARPSNDVRHVLDYLEAEAPAGSTVLAPASISRLFPGMVPAIRGLDYRGGLLDLRARRAVMDGFYDGSLRGPELSTTLDHYDVDYVIVESDSPADEAVAVLEGTNVWIDREVQDLRLYEGQGVETAYLGSFFADDFIAAKGSPVMGSHGVSWELYDAWQLDGSEPEVISMRGGFRVPEDAGSSGELTFKLQFAPSVNEPAGAVQWAVWVPGDGDIGIGDNFDYGETGVLEEAVYTYSGSELAGRRLEMALTTSTSSAFEPGSLVRFAIRRKGDSRFDTNVEDVWLVQVDVYYVRER